MVKRFFLVLLLSTRTVFAADLELNARQALTKMTHAMRVLNYQGTVAFLRNGKLETMKYFHAAEEGIEQERLLSLNSPLREIIRDADKVSCLFKSTQQVVVDHRPVGRSFLVDLPQNLDELSAIYDFEIVGEENVAMLPAYVVAIQPKDDFRYVRKIWIEQQQFLPLKVAVYDLSDTILEQVVFTDLQVKETLPFVEVKFGEASGAVKHIHQLQSQASDKAAFVINSLPTGFQEIFFTRRPMHNSNQPVDHLLLSDGFAAVSIYMENKNTTMQQGLQAVGAINSYSRTIDDWQLTVMGEVPAKTVKFIAEGIKLRPSNN
ncbi:MAG: MucB/RseB C-terminal domain-containing protein [Methylobacter sp.]|uniref:MucB/RseB C-terminal domain-containing protein n=1 Tax=unclassified Methylobacter TaxID=2635283 RepID=UPI000A54F1A8|nr:MULTISPECIES: MucB/RseB C-terminal domain-containing protein [unclassified Methylobacter]MCL7422374.1 MucB/RseB C-terminal domain-containing protein [Methylobacter sp.]